MDKNQVYLKLKKALYLENVESAEKFLTRIRGYIKKEFKEKKEINSILLADMIADILKDIKEKNSSNFKHEILLKNKHICFKYYYEEIIELVKLGWGGYKIHNFLKNKKKCKAAARATIDNFIRDFKNGKS